MPAPTIRLVIEVGANGDISVNGPLHDKLMCYALLGVARDFIQTFDPKKAKQASQIVLASAVPPVPVKE